MTLDSLGDLLVQVHVLWLPMHSLFYFMELNYDKLEDFCHCIPSFVASPHLFLTCYIIGDSMPCTCLWRRVYALLRAYIMKIAFGAPRYDSNSCTYLSHSIRRQCADTQSLLSFFCEFASPEDWVAY